MLAPFDGPDRVPSELRVGEIRALRTFQLSPDGSLLPVAHGSVPWSDGPNTARCDLTDHTPAAPGCSCGFYAYGTRPAASRHYEASLVLAVVACWGRVVPGTLGLRAQHARIEALWVSREVLPEYLALVRRRYPSVALYDSCRTMIRQHRPTRLDSYQREPWRPEWPMCLTLDGTMGRLADRSEILGYLAMAAFMAVVLFGMSLLMQVLSHMG